MSAYQEPPDDHDYDTPRGNTPPQDMAAEQAVLGAMLLSATAIDDVAAILRPSDYYRPAHETIHATTVTMRAAGQPVDAVTVAAAIPAAELKRVGGALYLHTLVANVATAANAVHYARIVLDKARRRTAIATGQKIIQAGHTESILDDIYTRSYEALDAAAADHGPTSGPTSTWLPLSLEDVLKGGEIDPPPSLLARTDGHHLLYAGAVHTISGEPGSGKTFLALEAARQELAVGNHVTMIDFEDRASRVVGRLLALGSTTTQIRDQFHYIRPHSPIDPTTSAQLVALVRGSSLVILDGVTEAMTLHGYDLHSNADIASFYHLLPRTLADAGPAVAMIDHVVKDGEKQGRWAIGGQHKLAGIDGVAYLVKAIDEFGRGKLGHARITVSKDRPGYVEEIALGRNVAELWLDAREDNYVKAELKAPESILDDATGQLRPTHLMERVSRYIEITPGCLARTITEANLGRKQYVRTALANLVREGYVEVSTGARRAQFHHSARPYREDEE